MEALVRLSDKQLRGIISARNEALRFGHTFFRRTARWEELLIDHKFQALKRAGDEARSEFLRGSKLRPPDFLRIIDCAASVKEGAVVLIPLDIKGIEPGADAGYTAITHTYGLDVYEVFNCECASTCRQGVRPRAAPKLCTGHADPTKHRKTINNILGMCRNLVKAGVHYAWHDGVCIAQYDEEEVVHFIKRMGWIYASARESVVFLHNVATPMFPIGPGVQADSHDLISRWQTRVWTFQEAVLSRHRRYFVREGSESLINGLLTCHTFHDLEHELTSWFEVHHSDCIGGCVIEEFDFIAFVDKLFEAMSQCPPPQGLNMYDAQRGIQNLMEWVQGLLDNGGEASLFRTMNWLQSLCAWMDLLQTSCISFPSSLHIALETASRRESKHEGDRINSILALAGVPEAAVHKDKDLEQSTIGFFNRLGKRGLAIAVFSTNGFVQVPSWKHSWVPTLSNPLRMSSFDGAPNLHQEIIHNVDFKVLENGSLHLVGPLTCVDVQFSLGGNGPQICGLDRLYVDVGLHMDLKASIAGESIGEVLLPVLPLDLKEVRPQDTKQFLVSQLFRLYNEIVIIQELALVMPVVKKWFKVSATEAQFRCFMVFPTDIFKKSSRSFQTILVQGDLSSPVVKIGSFIGNKHLYKILQERRHYTRFFHSLESLIIL